MKNFQTNLARMWEARRKRFATSWSVSSRRRRDCPVSEVATGAEGSRRRGTVWRTVTRRCSPPRSSTRLQKNIFVSRRLIPRGAREEEGEAISLSSREARAPVHGIRGIRSRIERVDKIDERTMDFLGHREIPKERGGREQQRSHWKDRRACEICTDLYVSCSNTDSLRTFQKYSRIQFF